MKCNNCGYELPEDAKFCPNCGETVARIEKSKECKNCGTLNTADARFCRNCGTALAKSTKSTIKPKVVKAAESGRQPLFRNPYFIIMIVAILAMIVGIYYTNKLITPKSENQVARRSPQQQTPSQPVTEQQTPPDPAIIEETAAALKKDPNNLALNVEMGNLLFDSQRFSEAIPYYEKAIEIHPHEADVIVDLGVCYYNLENFEKASELFQQALEVNPDHVNALYNTGVVALKLKKMDVLMEAWGKLVQTAPESPQAAQASSILDEIHKSVQENQNQN
ncbi:MAG: tetratricopeptide repeat protein [Calditrichia bacterium]